MNAKENIREVRFPNIYILSNIVYHSFTLTLVITLAIKAVGFQKSDKLSVSCLQCIMVISKIKYKFFCLDFLLFQTKKFITSWLKR